MKEEKDNGSFQKLSGRLTDIETGQEDASSIMNDLNGTLQSCFDTINVLNQETSSIKAQISKTQDQLQKLASSLEENLRQRPVEQPSQPFERKLLEELLALQKSQLEILEKKGDIPSPSTSGLESEYKLGDESRKPESGSDIPTDKSEKPDSESEISADESEKPDRDSETFDSEEPSRRVRFSPEPKTVVTPKASVGKTPVRVQKASFYLDSRHCLK